MDRGAKASFADPHHSSLKLQEEDEVLIYTDAGGMTGVEVGPRGVVAPEKVYKSSSGCLFSQPLTWQGYHLSMGLARSLLSRRRHKIPLIGILLQP